MPYCEAVKDGAKEKPNLKLDRLVFVAHPWSMKATVQGSSAAIKARGIQLYLGIG